VLVAPSFKMRTGTDPSDINANSVECIRLVIDKLVPVLKDAIFPISNYYFQVRSASSFYS
ncbi:MAG: hypothetical protein ABSD49_11505, partial [Candidatus Bathyarchaeia archaeon]